jgi:hypothetical protein
MPKPVGVKVPVTVPVAVALTGVPTAEPIVMLRPEGSIAETTDEAGIPVPEIACPTKTPFTLAILTELEPVKVTTWRVKAEAAAIRQEAFRICFPAVSVGVACPAAAK